MIELSKELSTGWQLKNGHLRNESVSKALYSHFPALLKGKAN